MKLEALKGLSCLKRKRNHVFSEIDSAFSVTNREEERGAVPRVPRRSERGRRDPAVGHREKRVGRGARRWWPGRCELGRDRENGPSEWERSRLREGEAGLRPGSQGVLHFPYYFFSFSQIIFQIDF